MSDKSKDLTGQRFGKLTAIRPTKERGNGGSVVWECLCDCGKTTFASLNNLEGGSAQSCGCLKIKDLTGQKFGKLTVIRPTERRENRSVVWECRCDCGNTVFVSGRNLKSRNTQSCGCLKKERPGTKPKDLTNKQFGRLTAIRPTEKRGRGGYVVWECLCECGKTAYVDAGRLTSGNTRSCGCLYRDRKSTKTTAPKIPT